MARNLTVPQLIITPPSREPTPQPQLIITAADWERYPGITFAVAPSVAPKPRSSLPKYSRRRSPRLPSYRPPAPPVEPVDLPTPITEQSERWLVSGRARRSEEGWERADSGDEKCSSPIHDAADDAWMAYMAFEREKTRHADACDAKAREAGFAPERRDKARRSDAAKEAGWHERPSEAAEAGFSDSKGSDGYVAFTTAYARVGEAYMDSMTTDRPMTSLSRKRPQRAMSRPPPPVMPLDLPGSRRSAVPEHSEVDEKREVEKVEEDQSRHRRRSSWWSLGRF